MIEINNEELAKVLNLWTGTEDWTLDTLGKLCCGCWAQRMKEGRVILPTDSKVDKEAHALVNFMLKERKYPNDVADVFYPVRKDAPNRYVEWVRDWEKRFGDKPKDDQPKLIDHCEASEQPVVDHSIPVRYDHIISTEELVKRAQERWPDDGWMIGQDNRIVSDGWFLTYDYKIQSDCTRGNGKFIKLRNKLLTLIDEARAEKTTPEILDKIEGGRKELCGTLMTKAERFYTFLATPQPDISPGLWGLEREPQPITVYSEEVCCQCLGMGKFDGVLCVKDDCKARL